MPSYKLYYFAGRGWGETSRLLLVVSGCEFEDIRVSRDKWPEMKPKTPLGQVPVLEVDGQPLLPQSRAIERFLAREFGLYGSNNMEGARIDAVCDSVKEMITKPASLVFYEKDEEKKKAELAKFYAEEAPRRMEGLIRLYEMYGGGQGFFVGDKMSLADINFYALMEYFDENELKKYPKMDTLNSRVASDPRIVAYMKSRPANEF